MDISRFQAGLRRFFLLDPVDDVKDEEPISIPPPSVIDLPGPVSLGLDGRPRAWPGGLDSFER
ncbi:MAG: hypothetical protein HYV07_14715 [Deltaproteobacteria bacterium]|nr:hypothetical protein [Deltaproteobacteria bacterium]